MQTEFGELDLTQVRHHMKRLGVERIYAKFLAANDNSKNQPYFGGDFGVLNILPAGRPEASSSPSSNSGIFKAKLDFSWLADNGSAYRAPNAKLILYPQYPEVRFSGYLSGTEKAPSGLMGTTRVPGRLLLLGVAKPGRVIGYAASPSSSLAQEVRALHGLQPLGVFLQLPHTATDSATTERAALLAELCRIATQGWITSKRLTGDGAIQSCLSPNCGGYTLEAELGIIPNGYSEPDFLGWEIKQHGVNDFTNFRGGVVTLMTPEPSAGLYKTEGVVSFVREFGYPDTQGRADRFNFGGTHRSGLVCEKTHLTLTLLGYDHAKSRITDAGGGISLIDQKGRQAATWLYSDLIAHWNRKHAIAAYVPSMRREQPLRQYCYASRVRLGTGTDFSKFLEAVSKGRVYYDPGIKVENYSGRARTKRRSQFRIKSTDLDSLYYTLETVDACPVKRI
jgi:hypothetical protein